ncbi:heterokaryon incompatibility protein-domain-containing protein [Sordaria brevicollis]|uniref:Heterokaryon incompatibility protein-domain-containing protein n=1 Tax=Sordaria brevicollis TaxID=83679 RepID=A0AAE0PM07_SORBR|nr:heterokaryon incompatibility protein-domain-containing protein [Sordaria brevicollis]
MASSDEQPVPSRYASRELNKLCDRCQEFFPTEGPWFWDQEGTTQWTLPILIIRDLHEKAEAGCHLCRVFLDSLLPLDIILENRHGFQAWYDCNKGTRIKRHIQKAHCRRTEQFICFQVTLSHKKYPYGWWSNAVLLLQSVRPLNIEEDSDRSTWTADLHTPEFYFGPSPRDTTLTIVQSGSATNLTTSSFAQVRKWLTKCINCHKECSTSNVPSNWIYDYQRKVRFVDVGTEEFPDSRLIEAESLTNITGGIQYVTLSYRWTAETEVTSLKRSNKISYQASIPTDKLPRVYRDATTVARALGIRYLWIDSLCIIQDSLEDWDEQSSMMDQIYSYGVLNLSAIFSDRAIGLQIKRDPLAVSPCVLSRRLSTNSENGDALYEHWACFEADGINSFVDLAPLFQRAWCHQERILPMRNLYFGEQLIWQCRRTMANESFPSSICRWQSYRPSRTYEYAQRQHTSVANNEWQMINLNQRWEELVHLYSNAELTKQTDRLVALRGILNRIAGLYKETEPDWCIAGLWKRCLVKQLLWRRSGKICASDSRKIAHSKEVLAVFPSWSWASCATAITYEDTSSDVAPSNTEDMIQMTSIQADQPLGPDASYTAFETSSRIVLHGLIIEKFNSEDISQKWDTNRSFVNLQVEIFCTEKRSFTSKIDIWFDRPKPESLKHQALRILPIRRYPFMVSKGLAQWYGLLLESLGFREGIPTYRRMGLIFEQTEAEKIDSLMLGRTEYFAGIAGGTDGVGAEVEKEGINWMLLQLV